MSLIIFTFATFCTALVFVQAAIVFAQVMFALRPVKYCDDDPCTGEVRSAVLIPAHNEASGIERTILSAKSASDLSRVVVVADNCTDDTAAKARAAEAEVIERHDLSQVGKAYALGFGAKYLEADPPDVVVVVDADCLVAPAGFSRLVHRTHRLQRPIQALNLIDRRRTSDPLAALSTLGNRLHNLVRPLGWAKVGMPCLLTGSGMAFPWQLVRDVGLQKPSLGEDKQLGIEMALAGYPPSFYPNVKVASYVPTRYQGYIGQRTRWEHGHLSIGLTQIPRLVFAALRKRRLGLLTIAMDLAVPPVTLLAGGWLCGATIALALAIWQVSWLPLGLSVVSGSMLIGALLITWAVFSRHRVPFRSLLLMPLFVLKKLPIYGSLLVRGLETRWVRTERTTDDGAAPDEHHASMRGAK